jgi:hypothetical protein
MKNRPARVGFLLLIYYFIAIHVIKFSNYNEAHTYLVIIFYGIYSIRINHRRLDLFF